MLSSIHPLGERARHNRWAVTVTAFTLSAIASGGAMGFTFGVVGSAVLPFGSRGLLVTTALGVLAAGAFDIAGIKPPGPARQVNETWIGAFRGWVYGGAFGLELGLGFLTYVVTWSVHAMFLSALLTASPTRGMLVGATFGAGRSLSLLAAGLVDRPSRLTTFNRTLAKAGPVVRNVSSVGLTVLGVVFLSGGLL